MLMRTVTNLRNLLAVAIITLFLLGSIRVVEANENKVEKKTKKEIEEGNKKDDDKKHGDKHSSRLTDEHIPLQLEGFPQRPRPILEIGENFLGTGTLNQGIKLPTGAVWQPYFMVFGTYRSGLQTFDNGHDQVSEWANRFDLFGNLYLTFTERILIGFRPFDQNGRFTSYFLRAILVKFSRTSIKKTTMDSILVFQSADNRLIFRKGC